VSVSIGVSKSSQDTSQASTTSRGTNIQAGAIDITARDGDITVVGGKLQAPDITLDAASKVNLEAAANTSQISSTGKSSSAGVGVTIGVGGAQSGISFQASASQSKGVANGSETTYDNTLVTASDTLTIRSGGDTNLQGAQIAGKTIKMDVGGNLNLATPQDTSQYESKQTSSGCNFLTVLPPSAGSTFIGKEIGLAHPGAWIALGASGTAYDVVGGYIVSTDSGTKYTGTYRFHCK
jgi:filamentous hemagglutinin